MMVSRPRIRGREIFRVERFAGKLYCSEKSRTAQGDRETVSLRCSYTASERLVKLKSLTLIGGTTTAPPASVPANRTGLPIASKLFSMKSGESLNRKFFTAFEIFPFSIRNVPSRV